MTRFALPALLLCCASVISNAQQTAKVLPTEKLAGDVWVSPNVDQLAKSTRRVTAKVWFEDQFLGRGDSYSKRAKEFAKEKRRSLREKVVATLQRTSAKTFVRIEKQLAQLEKEKIFSNLQQHWIVNGFTCTTTIEKLDRLKELPGVKKIFVMRAQPNRLGPMRNAATVIPGTKASEFVSDQFQHPWYIRSLLADKVWKQFRVTGQGTLNVIHDFNFVFPANLRANVYHNPHEIAGNQKDDDGNGLVDDIHGFNFQNGSNQLTIAGGNTPQTLHGTTCANIVCGTGTDKTPFEFGIAPRGKWAGVIAGANLEAAVEWAILQEADTYSMSFSIPNLGEMRSHWRKVMEHGSFCGVYFVSGAGNFAQTAKVPVQMRVPEDIPEVVFAAAGVQRDLSQTPFSSKGPVEWNTDHYRDGTVQKPEVCAFNMGLPMLMPNGSIRGTGANGNSFAGPMFCGTISLMLSADPDLLPWDLKEIITATATDIGPRGIDYETGHGLINCYRSVKEVLRRKAIREGLDASRFTGREDGDELDIAALKKSLASKRVIVVRLNPNGNGAKAGFKVGDQVTKVNGNDVKSAADYVELVQAAEGDEVEIVVVRDGGNLRLKVKKANPGMRFSQAFNEPVFK